MMNVGNMVMYAYVNMYCIYIYVYHIYSTIYIILYAHVSLLKQLIPQGAVLAGVLAGVGAAFFAQEPFSSEDRVLNCSFLVIYRGYKPR